MVSGGVSLWTRVFPPLQPTPVASLQLHVVTCISDPPAVNGSTHDLFFGFNNLVEWLTEFGNSYVYWFVIKGHEVGYG